MALGVASRMAKLASAGLPLGSALDVGAAAGGAQAAVFARTRGAVARGLGLADALVRAGAGFSPADLALVRAGEKSGNIASCLELLATRLEAEGRARRRLASALAYPCLLALVALAVFIVIGRLVLPAFASMHTAQGVELPPVSRAMMTSAAVLSAQGPALMALTALLALLFCRARRRYPALKRRSDGLLLALPGLGRLTSAHCKTSLYATLAALLSAGVETGECLSLATATVGNAALAHRVKRMHILVTRGFPLSRALSRAGLDGPGCDSALLAVAESSGDYASSFEQLAAISREQRERGLEVLIALSEPFSVALIAAVAAAAVVGVYQPVLGSAAMLIAASG